MYNQMRIKAKLTKQDQSKTEEKGRIDKARKQSSAEIPYGCIQVFNEQIRFNVDGYIPERNTLIDQIQNRHESNKTGTGEKRREGKLTLPGNNPAVIICEKRKGCGSTSLTLEHDPILQIS